MHIHTHAPDMHTLNYTLILLINVILKIVTPYIAALAFFVGL